MNADEKTCQFCLDTIKAGALRCRYCDADLMNIASALVGASPTAVISSPPALSSLPPAALES